MELVAVVSQPRRRQQGLHHRVPYHKQSILKLYTIHPAQVENDEIE